MLFAEFQGILAGCRREFVYKALVGKSVRGGIDGTPPHHRYRRYGGDIGKTVVRNGFEIRFQESVDCVSIIRTEIGPRIFVTHILRGRLCLEGKDTAVLTQSSFATIYGSRAEGTLSHIVLPCPYHLYGSFDAFRDHDGFMRVVQEWLAAEAASEKGHIHDDVLQRNPHSFAQVGLHPVGSLYRPPNFYYIIVYMGNTIQRLHAGMGLIGQLVYGLYFFVGFLESGFKISACPVVQGRLV